MTAERDRLAGLRPTSDEPGMVMTRPVPTADAQLTINATISGSITAELRTDNNKRIPGFTIADCVPVTTVGFAVPVRWTSGELAQAPELHARLVFRLENAELFTFALE